MVTIYGACCHLECAGPGLPLLLLTALTCSLLATPATGDCFYDGQTYSNHSIWQPSRCTLCSCQDPVPVCETIQCVDPNCDYARGQQLQLPDRTCCPVCADVRRPCQFKGQPVPDGTNWTPSPCNNCVCNDGEVQCSQVTCSPVTCKPGQVQQSLPGQCCPRCIPAGRACIDNEGYRRPDGSEWSPLLCVLCVCRNGHHKCLPRQCPHLTCPQEELVAPAEGECCPTCRSQQCQDLGSIRQDGKVWQQDACSTCVCHRGSKHCRSLDCGDDAACQQGEILVTEAGQCCPKCVFAKGACDQERLRRYHGDIWNISDCEFCMCHKGNVQCRTLACHTRQCAQGEMLIHSMGKCCPECVRPSVCQQDGQLYQDGATWDPGPCTVCTCKHSQVICYHKSCPICPKGTAPVLQPGHCCGHCQKVECEASCSACIQSDPNYCLLCRDSGHLLQSGRCLDRCMDGFYPIASNTCLPCHSSCRTCIDGTRYHCSTCSPTSLLREGQCVDQCGPGFYLTNRQCHRCASSCRLCSGPGVTQCLSCSRPGQVLLQGQCEDACAPRDYVQDGKCHVCPSSCRTCVPDDLQCASCHSHTFLHKGRCLKACPRGFYGNRDSQCQACHPSCASCDDGYPSQCTSCPDDTAFVSGRCVGLCPIGGYLTPDRICADCSIGCAECSPSYEGQSLASVCTRCANLSRVAFEDGCQDVCPIGMYDRDGICYDCDEKCEDCYGPGQCQKCFMPFLLAYGHCVLSCGQRSYTSEFNICKPCDDQCLSCVDGVQCSVCDSTTFLWQEACVDVCGPGLIADLEHHMCYENKYPPEAKVTGQLLVRDKDAATVPSHLIQVSDIDTPADRLTVHLEKLPVNGQLMRIRGGREVILGHGDTFTVMDLMEGKVRFIHRGGLELKDEIALSVSDGQLTSEMLHVPVRILPPDPLSLTVNKPFTVVKGTRTTLSLDTLDLQSMVQDGDIVIYVVDGPTHGNFMNQFSGEPVNFFTLNELHMEEIVYFHHGNSSSTADMVVLLASDHFQQVSIVLTIILRLKNSLLPVVVANNGGQVLAGRQLQITKDILEVRPLDPASTDVIFTLVPTVSNPGKGEVMMIVPTPEGGPGRGWEDMGEGSMGAKMFRFLQRDINEGRIYYKHQGAAVDEDDIFTFEVADMADPPNVLQNQSFLIQVIPELQDDSSSAFALPTLAPGVQLGMTVLENQVVPITSANLAYQDFDTGDRDLVYRLTSLLSEDEGTIEHADFPQKPVLQFTQADINNNRIIYRPPDEEIGLEEKEVSFNFVLTDGGDDRQLPEQKFTIRVLPVNNMPPRFLVPNPEVTVVEGGTVPMITDILEVVDSDTMVENLEVTVVEEPNMGRFGKVNRQSVVVLRTGDTFSYTELASSTFQYSHSGAEGPLKDSIKLSVSDGTYQAGTTIRVTVLKVDKSAPILLASSSCQINVTEGDTVWIAREHLAFKDSDVDDKSVSIIMSSETAHGHLFVSSPGRAVRPGDRFTQDDINNRLVRYVADSEIGTKAVTELLYFNVSDASRNLLPSQVMSVLIIPVDNQAPLVTVGADQQVLEGGEAQITAGMISVMDVDTPLSGLTVLVNTPPSFGQLQNHRPVFGSEKPRTDPALEFTVKDLLEGHIYYVQSDHEKKEPAWDAFLFTVTDGLNQSPLHRFNFSVILINDEPPHLVTEQLFVKEGQAVTLTNASMYIVDLDSTPEDLTMSLLLPPTSGTLKRKAFSMDSVMKAQDIKQNGSFTYEDILNDLIVYEHNDDETTSDMFVLHVTDGDFNDTKQLNIIIGLINDETPRVTINRGLRVKAGTSTIITSADLRATDVDSEDSDIIYTMKKNPTAGRLQRRDKAGQTHSLSVAGPRSAFTQNDIDRGRIEYVHEVGEVTGTLLFKFMLSDTEGNDLIDQDFFITVMEDRFPPAIIANEELVMEEGARKKITTKFLSFTDVDSEPGSLLYQVFEGPSLGHIELSKAPGVPVVQFTQSDLAAGSVSYVHTSLDELYMDKFLFSITDGTNEIIQTFYITLVPVDDAIPMVINKGLRVQEGVRKLLTEFDLKAVDPDTKEENIVFTIMQPPIHGTLDLQIDNTHIPASRFTMADIYENRVSYHHDGNEEFTDAFTFTVSDGTNPVFMMQSDRPTGGHAARPLSSPQEFKIEVIPMDDGMPVLHANLGLEYLEKFDSMAGNYITERELKAVDEDSPPSSVIYTITEAPKHGVVENTGRPGQQVSMFTQENIDSGLIRYRLLDESTDDLQDMFSFDLMDAKPNVVTGNTFHIRWSRINLQKRAFNVTETSGILQVPVERTGNLKQYAVVQCQTKPASAVSTQTAARPGLFDFVPLIGQIQFDDWQDLKMCSIVINDDSIYEGPETFYVELSSPTYALLGSTTAASITIYDEEDVPVIQFEQDVLQVNETDGYVMASIKRTGDMSDTVSVICSTSSMTATGSSLTGLESGSDFISRGSSNSYRVVFPPGIAHASCDIKLIDDSEYESAEQFQLLLSEPSLPASLGPLSTTVIIIEGPNDESHLLLSAPEYYFFEDKGVVEVEVLREGSDLSHTSSVWCATRLSHPPSATPGQDYAPSSSQITFSPGQVSQKCQLTILDDDFDPRLEGSETFEVFLSSAMGSSLTKPYHSVIIIEDDSLDVPLFTFMQDTFIVDERNRSLNATVTRMGDLSLEASVICFTRRRTAQVMMDFDERAKTNESRIFFQPGERQKNCTVGIVNDADFEDDEEFLLLLADPLSEEGFRALLGELHTATVTITNHDDVPKVQMEKSAYSVHEPSVKQQIATVVVRVVRTGATNQTTSVRCSTRDGSAQSGLDYNARSLRITFPPGVREVEFPVDILYNSDVEWHEAFTVLLGPEAPVGAMFGSITSATITILDNEVSGSLVLPAPPVVVSLLQYDDAEQGTKVEPSPGYPLICISPCDVHYPTYTVTHTLCEESGINASAIVYQWEVAMPPDADGSRSPFVMVSDTTLFTSTTHMVLDSIYFRPYFRVRCVAQPLHANGNPAVPLKSKPVTIGRNNGICNSPAFGGSPLGYHAQSFLATLNYVPPDSEKHANTIHIRVEVPHQDGMLPLMSTFPLHNIRFLLSEPVYRQQHVCSNIITASERAPLIDEGFLGVFTEDDPLPYGPGYDFPYQFDEELRERKSLLLYKHLNLKRCIWTFDAWYHMSELADICGGHFVSDFQVKDHTQTHLTVRVPIHVSYLFAAAPVGWTSMEHRTEMEFAFYYDTVLWKAGLETEGRLGGKLQIKRILIGSDGKLVIEFRTQAKFRGVYVLSHHTMPGFESRVMAPKALAISFDLQLTWSQQTFDSPHQMWQATSRYNLKDYTGMYVIELIPCSVTPTQAFVSTDPPPCTAQQPQRFEVPLSFQQTNRPVPVVYSLDTQLQLSNSQKMFLLNPTAASVTSDDWEFNGAFSRGQHLYGRVMWSPSQDLKTAYRLSVEKVYLCTGSNGYIPTYDPAGDVYNEGPQFGCIQPSSRLLHRFLVLDRENPGVIQSNFQDIPFEAAFSSERPELSPMLDMPGVDGFVFSVDPLYKVDSGHHWYLQVIYIIGPTNTPFHRHRREVITPTPTSLLPTRQPYTDPYSGLSMDKARNGTNMKRIVLDQPSQEQSSSKLYPVYIIVPAAFIIITAAAITIIVVCIRKRRRKQKQAECLTVKQNNLVQTRRTLGISVTSVASPSLSVSQQNLKRISSKREIRTMATVAKCNIIKAKDVNVITQNNINMESGTEV